MMQRKKNKTFFFLILVFTLPIISSYLLFLYGKNFHFHTTNHGVLLNPPLQINVSNNGAKEWQIIFAPKLCNHDNTQKIMFTLHQLRKALGENQKRVGLTLWVDATCQPTSIHDFHKFIFTQEQKAQLETALRSDVVTDKIFLLDPLGNLFMSYPATTDPMNIFQDLKKVLGASQIG